MNSCQHPSAFPLAVTPPPLPHNHARYDPSGNTQNDGTIAYTYDAESQIKTAAGVTYSYDGSGRRVSKSNGKLYWHGSGGEILAETDASGDTLNEYIFFGGKRIATLPTNTVSNSGFEQGLTGWNTNWLVSLVTDTTRAHSGSDYVQLTTTTTSTQASVITSSYLSVVPQQQVTFGGWAYLESGGASAVGWSLEALDANYNAVNYVGASPYSPATAGQWTYQTGSYTVPSGVAYLRVYCQIWSPNTPTTARCDDGFLDFGTSGGWSPIYYVEDLLGSSRAMTTANGTVCYDADFDPFGGEHTYTNSCSQDYKFEGKERDTETGNDDFGARYYTSRFGRWLSADWSSVPVPVPYANLTNPQTLNLYSMVSDDPESFADLDGHVQFASQGLTYPGEGGPSCASMGEGASSAPFTSGCGNDVSANESDAHRFEPLTWHFEPIDPNNLAKGRKLVPDDGDRACDGGSGRCYQWDAKTGKWVPLSLDESRIIIVSRRTVRLANGPMNVLIVVAAAEAAGITAVEAAPAVSAGAKAARANLKFDGPSPGFAYGNGRAFGIRWGKFGLIRVDLHPMSPGAKSQWHIHLFSVGGEEGLRFPISW